MRSVVAQAGSSRSPAATALGPHPQPDVGARPALLRELVLGLAVFAVYSVVAGADWAGRRSAAAAHARDVLSLERHLRVDVEPTLNRWLSGHHAWSVLADYEYAITYVVSAFVLLGWVYLRRPEAYRWARTSFVVLNLVGVSCFALYPLMPPRLLPAGFGFVDTVTRGHTWGSWGSPLVAHANTLAAMPSLHVGWALWVSVVLAFVSGRPVVQAISAVHVLVTCYVIVATGNHYVLDAIGAVLLVAVSVIVGGWLSPRPDRVSGVPVAGVDAFFVHVSTSLAPQQVGGAVLVDLDRAEGEFSARTVADVVRRELPGLPRFRQRLEGRSRWRRPRWVDVAPEDIDWSWHVVDIDLDTRGRAGEPASYDEVVARFAATPLPMDRPLWRFAVVRGGGSDSAGAVLIVHHVVADGIGTVGQALRLLTPTATWDRADPPRKKPGPIRIAAATAMGVAQLATDGGARGRLPGDSTATRDFRRLTVSLAEVRRLARQEGARVTDVLLCAVAGATTRLLDRAALPSGEPDGAQADRRSAPPTSLRLAVPLMIREPGASNEGNEGNLTAAVIVDVPLGDMSERDRLHQIRAATRRLRTPTRALGSRFVMQAAGALLPVPAHRWFATTVYGRRFFHGIVSNMPGPQQTLSLAGAPLWATFPVVPLAPGAPLSVGALGWDGELCVALLTDPGAVPDPDRFAVDVRSVVDELSRAARPDSTPARA